MKVSAGLVFLPVSGGNLAYFIALFNGLPRCYAGIFRKGIIHRFKSVAVVDNHRNAFKKVFGYAFYRTSFRSVNRSSLFAIKVYGFMRGESAESGGIRERFRIRGYFLSRRNGKNKIERFYNRFRRRRLIRSVGFVRGIGFRFIGFGIVYGLFLLISFVDNVRFVGENKGKRKSYREYAERENDIRL